MFEFSIVWLALYFVPSIVAIFKKMHNTGPVIVINLLLGWTFIGWIVALAMSVSQNKNKLLNNNNNTNNWLPPDNKGSYGS